MSDSTINQRLKGLIGELGMSVGAFSRALDVSETNVRNYIGRGSKPGADFLEKLVTHFEQVNLTWLVTGRGAPLLPDPSKTDEPLIIYQNNKSSVGTNHGSISHTGQNTSSALEQEVAGLRIQVDALQKQLATKDALLAAKDDIIAAKEEMLTLLRGQHNRPN